LRPDNSTNKKRKRRNAQAVLAEKVDEIVALLKVNPNQGDSITIPERSAPAATPSAFYSFPGLTVDVDEAEELLHHFQQHQAALVPYIEIPATTTASQLHDERPLLFLAVMTAASHYDAQRQEAFSKASIAWLADHVLIQGQKNLGLFQGMLLLLGWFHTQIYVNPQITNLLHLCMAMSVDLGLNQSTPPVTEFKTGPSLLDGPRRVVHGPGPYPQTRTLEERRAYAGCYYLSTVVASSFTVSTELPWTVQLEEACAALSSSGIASDLRLAKLVELQRIISEVNQTRKDIAASGHAGVIPLSVYITPFEARLRQLWDDTPEEVRQDSRHTPHPFSLHRHTCSQRLTLLQLQPASN
jgi:hypothetical protein